MTTIPEDVRAATRATGKPLCTTEHDTGLVCDQPDGGGGVCAGDEPHQGLAPDGTRYAWMAPGGELWKPSKDDAHRGEPLEWTRGMFVPDLHALPERLREFILSEQPTEEDVEQVRQGMDGGRRRSLSTTTRELLALSNAYRLHFHDAEGAARLRGYALDFAAHEVDNI